MSQDKYHEITKFIKLVRESFPNAVEVYTKGSCVRFALILNSVFPGGEIYYNQDHAVYELDGHFYDITGDVDGAEQKIKLKDYGIEEIYNILQLRYESN